MKNGFFIMFVFAVIMTTPACAPIMTMAAFAPNKQSTDITTSKSSPAPAKPSCATSTDFSLPDTNVIRKTVNLKKERQRVLRELD